MNEIMNWIDSLNNLEAIGVLAIIYVIIRFFKWIYILQGKNIGLKRYLGDSVYAKFDGRGIILTTENGLPNDPSNTIYLEPEVIDALMRFNKFFREIQTKTENQAIESLTDFGPGWDRR